MPYNVLQKRAEETQILTNMVVQKSGGYYKCLKNTIWCDGQVSTNLYIV